jgi:hypothetical protein
MKLRTEIHTGPELIRFSSFNDWVNHAKSRYASIHHRRIMTEDTVAIDASGRICRYGKQFMSARDRDAMPIIVYHIDTEFVE